MPDDPDRQFVAPTYDPLRNRFPALAGALARVPLSTLPTPIRRAQVRSSGKTNEVWIKLDNLSSSVYGGNKVRKLEYLLGRAKRRDCSWVASFGAVGSNHALATALHARQHGLSTVCFLSHQTRTSLAAHTLRAHAACGTTLVPFVGRRKDRIKTLRRHLVAGRTEVIPMGGSSWLGTVGPFAAGLELAEQISCGELPVPDRIYLAAGTMSTAAGIAYGMAAAGLHSTTVHAVRVSPSVIANRAVMARILRKTANILGTIDPALPEQAAANWVLRSEYFAPGYARDNPATRARAGGSKRSA